MRFLDPLVHSDVRSDEDLSNLVYFGTSGVITCAHAPRRFERAEELLGYFEFLLADEVSRVRSVGLDAYVALGVHPLAAPRRTFMEVWRELPELLGERQVVALGELGIAQATPREYGLLEHQLRLGAELGLPCIVRLPSQNTAAVLRQVVALARRAGLPPRKLLLHAPDFSSLFQLLAPTGFRLAVRLDRALTADARWPTWRALLDEHSVCLTGALGVGPGDVLAVTRAVLALQDVGEDHHLISRWSYGNALDLVNPPAGR